ncbi:hypothetical protein, partial [Alkalihalobacillus sp. CinArs1]|uniref:hypothetical protein n=1 Tax=Alkalihalobacillus sp. CinArs1 TaxID=2995314 RepID=UPI0022DD9A97
MQWVCFRVECWNGLFALLGRISAIFWIYRRSFGFISEALFVTFDLLKAHSDKTFWGVNWGDIREIFILSAIIMIYPRFSIYIRETGAFIRDSEDISANHISRRAPDDSTPHSDKTKKPELNALTSHLPSDVLLLQGESPQLPSARELNFRVL